MHFLSFSCLGFRHRSSSRLGVRGYRTVQYSLNSTTLPIPTPFSLHFFFSLPCFRQGELDCLIEELGPFLTHRSLPRGTPLAPRSPAGESLLRDREGLLQLYQVPRSSFSYHSQCSGRYGRCPSQGGTQVFGIWEGFLYSSELALPTLICQFKHLWGGILFPLLCTND